MSFADRLHEAVERTGNPCLIGLDPHLDLLPEEFAGARDPRRPRSERAALVGDFCCEVIDLMRGLVPAVKPQSAFFEQLGADGVAQWERVVRTARQADLLVIGDVKRGDIASTAAAYAAAFVDPLPGCPRDERCDAVTLSPLLGSDSVEPFLAACARAAAGAYLLVRTSNRGSADFQRHGEPELSFLIAEHVARWGEALMGACGLSSIGAVVGATHGAELAGFRARMPRTPLLLPGYGAQGATAADIAGAFHPPRRGERVAHGALVSSSRAVLFAWREERWRGRPWKDASRAALAEMIAELRAALPRTSP